MRIVSWQALEQMCIHKGQVITIIEIQKKNNTMKLYNLFNQNVNIYLYICCIYVCVYMYKCVCMCVYKYWGYSILENFQVLIFQVHIRWNQEYVQWMWLDLTPSF